MTREEKLAKALALCDEIDSLLADVELEDVETGEDRDLTSGYDVVGILRDHINEMM